MRLREGREEETGVGGLARLLSLPTSIRSVPVAKFAVLARAGLGTNADARADLQAGHVGAHRGHHAAVANENMRGGQLQV